MRISHNAGSIPDPVVSNSNGETSVDRPKLHVDQIHLHVVQETNTEIKISGSERGPVRMQGLMVLHSAHTSI